MTMEGVHNVRERKSFGILAGRVIRTIKSVPGNSCGMIVAANLLLAFCAMLPSGASAACGGSANPRSDFALLPQLQQQVTPLQKSEAEAQPSSDNIRPAITGLWFVNFFSAGAVWDQGFDMWHSDGTEILNDNSVPPSVGNVCLGIWKQTSHNTYKLRHPGWNWDTSGNLIGTFVLLETITIDSDADSYRGSFVYNVYDLSGKITSVTKGSLTARRVTVE